MAKFGRPPKSQTKTQMNIGRKLYKLRKARGLSQGDIEKLTGLQRTYVSRTEHGRIEPSVETLEKWAKALDVKAHEILFPGKGSPAPPRLDDSTFLSPEAKKLVGLFNRMAQPDQRLLLWATRALAARAGRGKG